MRPVPTELLRGVFLWEGLLSLDCLIPGMMTHRKLGREMQCRVTLELRSDEARPRFLRTLEQYRLEMSSSRCFREAGDADRRSAGRLPTTSVSNLPEERARNQAGRTTGSGVGGAPFPPAPATLAL